MKYKVDCGGANKYYGLEEEYSAGSVVTFRVPFLTDVNTDVRSDDVKLERIDNSGYDMNFSFIMPEKDVEISVTHSGSMMNNQTLVTPFSMENFMGMINMGQMELYQNYNEQQDLEDDGEKVTCPGCGYENKSTSKFCGNCGLPLKK